MKMSKKNYNKLKAFFDYTVENATDLEVEYILGCLAMACKAAADGMDDIKHGKNE